MKAVFTTILLWITFLSFSQNTYQITDTTKKWNTVFFGAWSWNIIHCGGTKTNIIDEEFLYNGTTFFNVYESLDSLQLDWEHKGYLTEDTVSKKVYFSIWYSDPDETGLIYDFDLLVGDSVIIDNYYAGFEDVLLICESIDSININGNYKDRFFLSTQWGGLGDIWIEGIGSKFGLLHSGFGGADVAGGSANFLCCSINDTVIYMDSIYNSCYIEEFYPQIVPDYYDTAYLNSNYEFLVQLSDTNNIDSIALIGDVIPDGFSFNEVTGLLTGIPNDTGSFPCIITVKNCDLGFLTDILYENIIVQLITSTQKKLNPHNIKIHPNPFDSYFYISSINHSNELYKIEIYDYQGKIMDKKNISGSNYKIDCLNYNNGFYILKIFDSDDRIIAIEKIIKNKGYNDNKYSPFGR